MPIQIYIAPQQGDGLSIQTAFNSILNDLIDVGAGDSFTEVDHPARRVSICTVEASTATLDAIESDGRATNVLPLRATDTAHLVQILDALFLSYKKPWRDSATAFLESHGIDTGWITGTHTMRDLLRFIVRMFASVQVADGAGLSDVKEFLKEQLNTTVGSIAPEKRNAIAAWLTARGVDVSWVTGSTTIREVVTMLPGNFAKLYGRDVPIRFAGEDL